MPANPFRDILWQIMWAQQQSLMRIDEGVVLDGTYRDGAPKVLRSKKPEMIRLIDQPERMLVSVMQIKKQVERLVTLMPLADDPEPGGIVNRVDRKLAYAIHGAVWLTDAEQLADKAEGMVNNPLARKLEALAEDIKLIVLDNLQLIDAGNRHGLCDDQTMGIRYDGEFGYPAAAFFMTVQATGHWTC